MVAAIIYFTYGSLHKTYSSTADMMKDIVRLKDDGFDVVGYEFE